MTKRTIIIIVLVLVLVAVVTLFAVDIALTYRVPAHAAMNKPLVNHNPKHWPTTTMCQADKPFT